LMQALRKKAHSLGVTLINGNVAAIISDKGGAIQGVTLVDGTHITAGHVAVTAGTETPRLIRPLGIDLPVEPRKRCVFSFTCRSVLPNLPLLIDPSGVYVRPEGEMFICGVSPTPENDLPATDFNVN